MAILLWIWDTLRRLGQLAGCTGRFRLHGIQRVRAAIDRRGHNRVHREPFAGLPLCAAAAKGKKQEQRQATNRHFSSAPHRPLSPVRR